jgi:hypothetical protein
MDYTDQLASQQTEEKDWLLCFLYIIRHCSRDLLQSWWKKDTQKRHTAFLRLLSSCLRMFEVRTRFPENNNKI